MKKDNEDFDYNAENMMDLVRIINAKGDTGEIREIIQENESLKKSGEDMKTE
ncbi:hypothetical protein ACE38V_10055 [Cytobacillus sp. Hz8]|uniref:hypothetical protein n=1 Tax=Cytobacillus sp. Hz8 TaxID=3347168 RepID=UPI0035DEA08D